MGGLDIIGLKNESFKLQEGTLIEGKNLWLGYSLEKNGGQGIATEKVFLSKGKLAALDFQPTLGMSVEVLYNKFGKVQTLRLLDEKLDFGEGDA